MTFHVRITLNEIHEKVSRGIIAIGETILIRGEGEAPEVLTQGINRAYKHISYQLSQSEDEDEKMKNDDAKSHSSEDSVNMARNVNQNQITQTRLRSKNVE